MSNEWGFDSSDLLANHRIGVSPVKDRFPLPREWHKREREWHKREWEWHKREWEWHKGEKQDKGMTERVMRLSRSLRPLAITERKFAMNGQVG